jgi:hypothetical protein
MSREQEDNICHVRQYVCNIFQACDDLHVLWNELEVVLKGGVTKEQHSRIRYILSLFASRTTTISQSINSTLPELETYQQRFFKSNSYREPRVDLCITGLTDARSRLDAVTNKITAIKSRFFPSAQEIHPCFPL